MTPSAFLRGLRDVSPADVADGIAVLDRRRDELAALAETRDVAPALAHLASKRLLASNTLRSTNAAERLAWDDANRWINERLAADAGAWTVPDLVTLNTRLGGSGLRSGPVYTGDDAYLDAEEVHGELDALAAHLAAQRESDLVASAIAYIALVTIHPFDNANGRTARLAADAMLLGDGYLPLCFLSAITSHVAQTTKGPARDPKNAVRRTLAAVEESYVTVLKRISQ